MNPDTSNKFSILLFTATKMRGSETKITNQSGLNHKVGIYHTYFNWAIWKLSSYKEISDVIKQINAKSQN